MKYINEAGPRDRIIFFVLGCLLSTIAYIAGDIDNINAQDTQDKKIFDQDVIIRGRLLVMGSAYIFNEETRASTHLEGGELIILSDYQESDKHPSLRLSANNNGASLQMATSLDNSRAEIQIITNSEDTSQPISIIGIKDKRGDRRFVTQK